MTGCLQGSRVPSSQFPTNFPLSPKSRIENGCPATTLVYRWLPSKQPVVCSNHTGGVTRNQLLQGPSAKSGQEPSRGQRRFCTWVGSWPQGGVWMNSGQDDSWSLRRSPPLGPPRLRHSVTSLRCGTPQPAQGFAAQGTDGRASTEQRSQLSPIPAG